MPKLGAGRTTDAHRREMSKAKTVTTFPDLQGIEAEAFAWIVKLDSGEVSSEDHAAFREWRERSQRHRDALMQACDFWGGLDRLSHLEVLSEDRPSAAGEAVAPSVVSRRRKAFRPRLFATAAAVVLLIGVAAILRYEGPDSTEQPQFYRTEVGAQETILLSDGSEVILNTDSRLEVRFSHARRDVRLLQGEAHFEIVSDPDRPFAVLAGNSAVRAVGTAFTVRMFEENVQVIVTEGSVELHSLEHVAVDADLAQVYGKDLSLRRLAKVSAGQNAVFGVEIEQIQTLGEETLRRQLAWHQGMLTFAGDPLSKVVDDVSRYTEISITIDDPALLDLPVGGLFRIGDVEALFDAVQQSLGVRVVWLDDTHVIIKPPA